MLSGFFMSFAVMAEFNEERIAIESESGRTIEATLYSPAAISPETQKVVVLHTYYGMIHGEAEPEDHQYAKELAETGDFMVLVPNYAKFGRKGYHAGITEDLSSVINWMVAMNDGVDGRVGIVGFSAGAYHALKVSTVNSKVASISAYYGPFDFDVTAFSKNKRQRFPESAIDFANKIDAPVLILHGTKDTETPVSQAKSFARNMEENGKVVSLNVYSGSYHRFDRGPNNKMRGERTKHGHVYRKDESSKSDAFIKTKEWLLEHTN